MNIMEQIFEYYGTDLWD